jgi:hypothetical protein
MPNPSLRPKCYSGRRPLAHSGELKNLFQPELQMTADFAGYR